MRQKEGSDASNIRLKKTVSAKFSEGDVKGAVRLLASEEKYVPQDDRTLARLAQKRPAAPNDLSVLLPPDDSCGPPNLASEGTCLKLWRLSDQGRQEVPTAYGRAIQEH